MLHDDAAVDYWHGVIGVLSLADENDKVFVPNPKTQTFHKMQVHSSSTVCSMKVMSNLHKQL